MPGAMARRCWSNRHKVGKQQGLLFLANSSLHDWSQAIMIIMVCVLCPCSVSAWPHLWGESQR